MALFSPITGSLWLYLGDWLNRKGLASLAESCYRNGSAGAGKTAAESDFRLAQLLLADKRDEEAASLCARALQSDPNNARLWCALGAARRRLAQLDPAKEAYEKAVALKPDYAQAWSNLGEWWLLKGAYQTALEMLEQALHFQPRLLEAWNNRVAALYEMGRFAEAEDAAQHALEVYPDEPALHVNLGNVLLHTGKARQAAKSFQRALECDAHSPEAQIGLSTVLGEAGRLAETLEYWEQEIAVKGENAQRLASLALAQQMKGDWPAAEATAQKVLTLQFTNISALVTLASCHSRRGEHGQSIELLERALRENPEMPAIRSNIAFDATYLPGASAEEVFALHAAWADCFEEARSYRQRFTFEQDNNPERPLRIGYVSGDFGRHPVGFLLQDVVRHHDKQHFSIHCYSTARRDDDITAAIRQHADAWVDALLMTDDELAEKIHEDRIDILVDLSGHTAYNRLPVFVRKPAPVQATWIGYFHSTGLESIDYFITDPTTTPLDAGQLFSETPVWLPHSRFCYAPPAVAPAVAEAPVLERGLVTFGCFNRIDKLVDPVIDAWAEILKEVPTSRLLLKSGGLDNEGVCEKLRERFVSRGVDAGRLELRGPSSHFEMLAEYSDIDIALDPFPFNGGMTTLESLWMGVPMVTLAGSGIVARQSASALTNIGLPELIFADRDAYIKGAVALAYDTSRLTTLRRELRARMSNSPICQPDQFSHDLEALYRRMWQAWCRGEKLATEVVQGKSLPRKTVLHVGCGPADKRSLPMFFQSGWREVRLDIDQSVAPDVVASMLDMTPVDTASMDAVYSSHNIEHLHPHEVVVALREFRRVLKPDGILVLTCPDLQSVAELVAKDQLEEPAYISPAGPIAPIDILYGHRAAMERGNLYMAHKTGFTARSMDRVLKESGFTATVVARGQNFDLWVLAYPSDVLTERVGRDRALCFPSSVAAG